ncbi:hypothetical protein D9M68_516560 [compost metagenome]
MEFQRAVLPYRRRYPHSPARHGAQARGQFVQRDRLDQVVVGAGVEPADAAFDRIARGQHDHGNAAAARTPAREQRHAVLAGQAQVQHHGVIAGHLERMVGLCRGAEPVDRIVQQLQPAPQAVAEHGVVFNDKDSHVPGCFAGVMRVLCGRHTRPSRRAGPRLCARRLNVPLRLAAYPRARIARPCPVQRRAWRRRRQGRQLFRPRRLAVTPALQPCQPRRTAARRAPRRGARACRPRGWHPRDCARARRAGVRAAVVRHAGRAPPAGTGRGPLRRDRARDAGQRRLGHDPL